MRKDQTKPKIYNGQFHHSTVHKLIDCSVSCDCILMKLVVHIYAVQKIQWIA